MIRTVRPLRRAELDTLLDWAAAEGWNPGLSDAGAFWAADPRGFIGAFVGDVMVAGISAIAYDDRFGFIGLYICHPDWRGQGHGKAVWDAAMTYLGNRTIGLDGVPEQQANYESVGFTRAYDTIRMAGALPAAGPATPVFDITKIAALDRQAFLTSRDAFLTRWLKNEAHCVIANNRVTGYAVSRKCREHSKIGPIFAETLADSLALLNGFGGNLQIDVPAYQIGFLQHLRHLGFSPGFTSARMYRGPAPDITRDKVFAISSLELG